MSFYEASFSSSTRLTAASADNGTTTTCARLVSLVARGHIILSELFKLAKLVPEPFIAATSGIGPTTRQLESLIHHFGYFKEAEAFEARIEANPSLKEADETLFHSHFGEIQRFYLTFESIQKYSDDLNRLVAHLEEETGQSLVRFLQDEQVCQLLCEAYFLLGYSLLTVDRQFEGTLRERILVSYYRYSSSKSSPSSLLDSTCNLVRTTGFRCARQWPKNLARKDASNHRPPDYPESFLKRLQVDTSVIELLISKLNTIDLYNQTIHNFPHPEHRSCALAKQASIIHVLLYFSPSTLSHEKTQMREITNRFFYDNWVTSLYLGDLINLFEEWQPYAAAREACGQMFESTGCFERLAKQNRFKFDATQAILASYLSEGWLDKSTVLQHHPKMLDCIRDANMLLKWFMLHSQLPAHWVNSTSKTANLIVLGHLPSKADLYDFLQSLADFERKFTQIYNLILEEQLATIEELRAECILLIEELISIFNNSKPVLWVQTGGNLRLSSLLCELKVYIEQITPLQDNPLSARDSFFKVIKMLDSYKETYTDGKSLQVNQLFNVTRESMIHILKLLGLSRDIKSIVGGLGDFSYAWRLMDSTFTDQMQELIRNNPLKVQAIDSTFNKLLPILDRFTVISECSQIDASQREHLKGVILYHSSKLIKFIRHVLQVFPETIMQLVYRVDELQRQIISKESSEFLCKLSLDSLKDSSCLEARNEILKLTYKIAQYAESMLSMRDTMIGPVRLNPHQMLADGIRDELSKQISELIREALIPIIHDRGKQRLNIEAERFLHQLELLQVNLSICRASLEYVQEYLSVNGLLMWNEELGGIIKRHLNQLQRAFLNLKPEEKDFEQENELSVLLRANEQLSCNPILRLMQYLLHLTEPRLTIYDEQMNAWYVQVSSRVKVVDLNMFEALVSALGPFGLSVIDELCCMMLKRKLESFGRLLVFIKSKEMENKSRNLIMDNLNQLEDLKSAVRLTLHSRRKLFQGMLAEVAPYGVKLTNHLLSIGQLQAIRMNISQALSCHSNREGRSVYKCLERIDSCLLFAIRNPRTGCRELSSQQTTAASSSSNSSSIEGSHNDLSNSSSSSSSSSSNRCLQKEEEEENVRLLTRQEVAQETTSASMYWREMDEHNSLLLMLAGAFERVGLSDPISKLYTPSLTSVAAGCDSSASSGPLEGEQNSTSLRVEELIFLILLDQCSKFKFCLAISGFIPRESKSLFYELTPPNADAQPLFYGLVTLINHLQPYIFVDMPEEDPQTGQVNPLLRILNLASLYVNSMINEHSHSIFSAHPQNLTPEVVNMILAMIEIVRLTQQSPRYLLANSHLPEFVYETFQFIVFHLTSSSSINK